MPQRKSSREVGSGDSFEAGVKTGLTEKMALEQRLEGGAVLIPGAECSRYKEEPVQRP